MTPKLYDALSEKLGGIWGDYAGWAHSVGVQLLLVRERMFIASLVGHVYFRSQIICIAWP